MIPTREREKLAKLREVEGFETLEAMLEAATFDSVSPAICMNEGCNYASTMDTNTTASHHG
jgi:hypothetical protein